MIGLLFFFRRKPKEKVMKEAASPHPAAPGQAAGKPSRFTGGMPERTQDLLGRQDGERVGFRKPVQG